MNSLEALDKFKLLYESKCKEQPKNLIGFDMCYITIKQDLERLETLENRINNKIKELESEKFCYEMNGNDFSAHILRVQIKLLKEVLEC
jgi:hypothetical protein